MDIKCIVGYEKLDNMLTGIALGSMAIFMTYYGQIRYYAVDKIGSYSSEFDSPFLKRSLLGALLVFLIFNYFDKTYAMKGVLLTVIAMGIYLVIKYFI
jgi:hypothetical protein